MNEQRVREIVREEIDKRGATALTIAPKIEVTTDVDVEKVIKEITEKLEEATRQSRSSFVTLSDKVRD